MDGITDAELREIRERAERATPGPWGIGERRGGPLADDDFDRLVWPGGPGAPVCALERPGARERDDADAAFIAHARTDVPRLLDEIERLRADAERWQHIAEHAYLATSDEGELLLTLFIAENTDVDNAPWLKGREVAQLEGDVPPYGVVNGVDAITRAVNASRAACATRSHPAASAADNREG